MRKRGRVRGREKTEAEEGGESRQSRGREAEMEREKREGVEKSSWEADERLMVTFKVH